MGMDSPLSKKRMVANAIGNTFEIGSDVGEIAFQIPGVTHGFFVFVQAIGYFLFSFLQILGNVCVILGQILAQVAQVLAQVAQVAWAILEPVLKVVVAILSCLK